MEFSLQELAGMDDAALEREIVTAANGHLALESRHPAHTLKELLEEGMDSLNHTGVLCSLQSGLGIMDVRIDMGETDPARVFAAIRYAVQQAMERARWAER